MSNSDDADERANNANQDANAANSTNEGANPSKQSFDTQDERDAYALGEATGQALAGNFSGVRGVDTGDISSRAELAERIGAGTKQFGGSRDIYETLGYDENLKFDDFFTRYLRQDVAKRIVNAPANKTWSEWPEVDDDGDAEEETDFEADVKALDDDADALEALRDTDRYAGIGYVGALVIGFADGEELSEPVNRGVLPDDIGDAVAYLTPCHENAIKRITLDEDETSERFGEPEEYRIDFSEMDSLNDSGVTVSTSQIQKDVHWERVILVQPDRPRLEPVFNRLMDLEKVTGASAELFWRGADYGLALNMDADAAAQLGTKQRQDLQDDIEKEAEAYYHGLQPFLKTAGVDVERLGGEAVDPTGIADLLLQLISGTIKMPKRILTGSERGELASTQDRASWLGHIGERQRGWGESELFRPFVERFELVGLVTSPTGERFDVEWPNLFELNEVEEAEVMERKANAFSTAANGLIAAPLGTEGEVRQEILGWGVEVGSETGETVDVESVVEEPDEPEPEPGDEPGEGVPPDGDDGSGPEQPDPDGDDGGDGDGEAIPDDLSDVEDDADLREQFERLKREST